VTFADGANRAPGEACSIVEEETSLGQRLGIVTETHIGNLDG
jgi:hypothetical protein